MNSPLPAPGPAPRRNWTRRLVNVLVALVVIAVAAATFVFSYDGVHAIALLGGVSKQLARYYPGLFDAVLVIACLAAVMLRDGRWWTRLWAWAVIFIVLAAIGATDVLHAMNYTLRHRPTEGIVAAAPVVAVLLAFSLLLTLLRQSRTQVAVSAGPDSAGPAQAGPAPVEVPALPVAVAAPIALPPAPVTDLASAPTREDGVDGDIVVASTGVANTEQAPRAPEPLHPATESTEVIAAAAPSPDVAGAPKPAAAESEPDEPAPPTVIVPALAPETKPIEAVPRRSPRGIRYAGNGVPGMAGKPRPDERGAAPDEDYWETEEAPGQFAGLVYPARETDPDTEDAASDSADDNGTVASGTGADEPATGKTAPELDDDAPPFATAPFAAVPRLNRVRSMPAPPADEDEE